MIEYHQWLLVAFIAPTLWAITNIIDVYFVESIYRDEYDGAIISGLFQILPWIFVPIGLISFALSEYQAAPLFFAGFFYITALFFFFRCLFRQNDASLIQILWNLNVPLTLFASWLLWQSPLHPVQYVGCALVFLGVCALTIKGQVPFAMIRSVALPVSGAIVFLTLSMLLSGYGYDRSTGNFFGSYLLFSLGSFTAAIGLTLIRMLSRRSSQEAHTVAHLARLSSKYFIVFFLAELLALFGTIASQRALDLSPSVGLVATIESLTPAIIIFLSIILALTMKVFRPDDARWGKLLQEQTFGMKAKIISTVIIAVGIYCIAR